MLLRDKPEGLTGAGSRNLEHMNGELLDIACERIIRLERPAYIKNSELRFVAVNAAYARLFGRSPDEFKGQRSEAVDYAGAHRALIDCERRALVFGREESAVFTGDGWFADQHVSIERFLPGDGRIFVLGLFSARPEERIGLPASEPDGAAASRMETTVSEALDMVEVGLGMVNADGSLAYCNSAFRAFYEEPCGPLEPGVSYEALMQRVYDYGERRYGKPLTDRLGSREAWVRGRLENIRKPHHDAIEQACDGRWLRAISRRLDNGSVIVLRLDVSAEKSQQLELVRRIDETQLLRSVLEEMPVATFVRDEQHLLTFVNGAYCAMLGAPREALIGTTEAGIYGAQGDEIHGRNENVLRTGVMTELDDEILGRDGSRLPVMTRLARIESGGRKYIVGSMSDVSKLKAREAQVEEARRDAENLHRDLGHILDSVPVAILILGADLTIEFVNPAFHDMWEWPHDMPLPGTHFRDYVRVNFEKGLYTEYGETFEAVYEGRLRRMRACGALGQQEVAVPNGKTVIITTKTLSGGKLLVTYVDISAMRDNERQMRETRHELERVGQFMRDATRVMTQGLVVVNDGRIVLSNEAAARILHIPAGLVAPGGAGGAIFDHCAARGDFGDDPDALRRSWGEIFAKHQPFTHGFLAAGKTWVHMEASFSGQGHWMFVLNDLTEMKQREEELERLLARSEAADRAKSDFLANMSHEIRTPMNGVLGMAELLGRTHLDTRQRTFVDIIGKSGNALLTIINDILDFSKIDAGQMVLKKAPFDPVEAVEDVATLLSSSAAEKDLELMVRSAPGVPPVVIGDAGRFRQIVTNLVGNAVKFTDTGHVLVEIFAEPDGEGMVMLGLRVEDTGIGIPPEKRTAIFEKFSQGDGTFTRRHDGTGLGLAITSRLIDLFGGYITVESQPGAGSVFSVRLPVAVQARRSDNRELPVNVRGASVLIIDGNPVSRGILEEQVRRWGFDALGTGTGRDALVLLSAAREMGVGVDAIVLDDLLPDMSGVELARILRDDPARDELALICLTSMDAVGGDDFFSALKVQAHLMKPARAKVLRAAIVDTIRAARIRRMADPSDRETQGTPPSADTPPVTAGPALYEVLVAEDNEVNCIVFSQILQGLGVRFLLVNDGQQAVEAWKAHRPGMILMDVSMPVLNGHQATAAIREMEAEAKEAGAPVSPVPIIGVTAHAHDVDRELCFRSGMNDYLSKPLSPEMLEEKIRQWLPQAASDAVTIPHNT